MSEPYQALRKIRAIALLDDDELATFHQLLRREEYPPRHTLISQGEIEPRLFFLTKGHANVTRDTPEGEMFLILFNPGDYFGEAAIFNDHPRSANVRSVDDVEVYVITRDEFRAFMDREPNIAAKILFGMFREHMGRLQRTSSEIMSRRTFFSRHGLNALFT